MSSYIACEQDTQILRKIQATRQRGNEATVAWSSFRLGRDQCAYISASDPSETGEKSVTL
jgi:hypothetical protein